jgi:xanthine/uracil/vitamin C permease (AzgA family)
MRGVKKRGQGFHSKGIPKGEAELRKTSKLLTQGSVFAIIGEIFGYSPLTPFPGCS